MLAESWSEPWLDWRKHVVALIRLDFRDVLQDIGEDDIDWDAWRPLYEAGRSPKAAVDSAFVRTLDEPEESDEQNRRIRRIL